LDVNGVIRTQNSGSAGAPSIELGTSAQGNGLFYPTTNTIAISTNDAERMRITSGGNVLIGTNTDAGYKLDVLKVGADAINIGAGNDFSGLSLTSNAGTWAIRTSIADALFFYDVSSSAERMRINSSGELLINTTSDAGAYYLQVNGSVYATAYYESSDLRKKNVLSERVGSDGINTITFKWNDGRDSLTHIGYAAQQVEKVLPDAVKTNPDGYKTINYDEVQTLKIANLEKEIAELKEIIKKLIK
jgi:hypothetical protein